LIWAVAKYSESGEQVYLQMFDIENETSKELKLNMRFIKMEGLSQIIIDNKLFLCGLNCTKNEKFKGSSFISIDPVEEPVQITFLVNSKFPHYHPSLIEAYPYIIVIGGKNNLYCEMFHKERNTWYELPELPEERYNCNLVYDDKKSLIYLFGGFSNSDFKVCSSILKLQLKKLQNKWETIVVTQNILPFTQKIFSCICSHDNSNVFVLGGRNTAPDKSNNESDTSDDIIEWDFLQKKFSIVENQLKLNKNCTFSIVKHSVVFNGYHYMVDDDNLIHKISFKEGNSYVYGIENLQNTQY